MNAQTLAGQTALVTGGARRLGRAVARALAAEGARVVIHYRGSAEAAHELATELRATGRDVWVVQADLADQAQVESLVPRAMEAAGGLDILVNNASIFAPDSLCELRFEDIVTNLAANAWAPFALGRSFARWARRGRIVNFLDTRVAGYDWSHVSYILSKNVLATLTRMTALEYAPEVTVNAVAPGLILPPPGQDESYLDGLAETVPLRRHGDEADVAEAVLYLVQSDFVTGQVLYVDGGRHLRSVGQ